MDAVTGSSLVFYYLNHYNSLARQAAQFSEKEGQEGRYPAAAWKMAWRTGAGYPKRFGTLLLLRNGISLFAVASNMLNLLAILLAG